MKKLMSVMLGLSLFVATTSLFAQSDKPGDDKKTTKGKKSGKKKSTDKDTTKKS